MRIDWRVTPPPPYCRCVDLATGQVVPWVALADEEAGVIERYDHDGQTFVLGEDKVVRLIREERRVRIESRRPDGSYGPCEPPAASFGPVEADRLRILAEGLARRVAAQSELLRRATEKTPEAEALRAALAPFAAWARKRDERRAAAGLAPLPDGKPLVDAGVMWADKLVPTMGDCRRAAEVLGEKP